MRDKINGLVENSSDSVASATEVTGVLQQANDINTPSYVL